MKNSDTIDDVFCAHMPTKYYPQPSLYWQSVWKKLKPDLVFLGEINHPLEEIYRRQCNVLGGILLIDDSPVSGRSEDLLESE
jgi:hypothetical protein